MDKPPGLPPPHRSGGTAREYDPKIFRQETPGKPPLRAIKIKGNQLRAAMRNGAHPLDWSDIHERFVDLWQESRLALWRAKHSKAGTRQWDEKEKKYVLTFIADERLVLQAIDTTRDILADMIKLRREMGHEDNGIPRWAIEGIEKALRNHPDAMKAVLKELAAETEKVVGPD
jgi:hypothetical protein